jgi:hypothetical protein
MAPRRRRALLIILALLGLGLLALLMGTAWLGERLSRPMPARVGPPPASLGAESLSLPGSPSDRPVAAWFVSGRPGAGAVLLLHGLHGDRRQMLGQPVYVTRAGELADARHMGDQAINEFFAKVVAGGSR